MTAAAAETRLIDEVDEASSRFREAGRAAMGVDGSSSTEGFWASLRSHHVGVYSVAALGLLAIVDQFQLSAFTILGPEISRGLGVSRAVIGLLLLLSTLALTLAALPMAALVQAHPRRALVAKVTALAWSVATLFTGFATNAVYMGGILSLDGATSGSVQAVHLPLLMDVYPTAVRARVVSTYHSFVALGALASPLLVALLAGPLDLTWRGVFLTMGVVSTLVALVGLGLRDPGFGRWDSARLRATVRGEEVPSAEPRPDADEYSLRFFEIARRLFLIPTVRRVLFSYAVLGMLLVPLSTYFVFFLEQRWSLGPAQRGLFFSTVPVFSIATIVGLSRFNERLFRRDPAALFRLAAVMQIVAILLIGVAVFSPYFWLLVVAYGFGFASLSALHPALNTGYLSVVRPQMRPHASALAGIFTVGVGGFAGLLLLSGLDRRYGISGAIFSICVPGVISALVLRSASQSVGADLDRTVAELVEEEELQKLAERHVRLPMLACRKVDFHYGQLQVLFDVDFTVDDGEMVALLGTNGAGKSTLLRVVSGLGLPSKGSVRFRGGDITFLDAERRVRLGITQIPGGRAVYPPLSVVDNLRVQGFGHGRNKREVDRGIEAAFNTFPRLAERRNVAAGTLSGGEQQMLGLSKALIMRPRLFLIDELSLGLAPKVVGELLTMVRRINAEGTAVVLVEQSVNVALSLVQHAYFMEKGEVRFDGSAAALLRRGDLLRSVFLEGASSGFARGTEKAGTRV
ncbi:MAG: MFS transporter [Candidatus Dormibacteraeota bacterium]|nr:MFS transporter [Candidatus Dormibacteraeota bacterium]